MKCVLEAMSNLCELCISVVNPNDNWCATNSKSSEDGCLARTIIINSLHACVGEVKCGVTILVN